MSALYVSPALLVELEGIRFAANLLASLFAVFVVVDPPYSGLRRTLEEPAWVPSGQSSNRGCARLSKADVRPLCDRIGGVVQKCARRRIV